MSLVIRFSSNYVNAVIFFLIDVPAVWAVHRGLLAVQGYYLYRIALKGRRVPLARSRIPVVSGELLRGVTRFPSLFVLINIGVLLIIFFATLGVNEETRLHWEPTKLQNVTTFPTEYRSLVPTKRFRSRVLPDDLALTSCSTRNESYLFYWPVAYNITVEKKAESSTVPGSPDFPGSRRASNEACQRNAPGWNPSFSVLCVPLKGEPCHIESSSLSMELNVSVKTNKWGIGRIEHAEKNVTIGDNDQLMKFTITETKSSIPEFSGFEGIALITKKHYGLQPIADAVLLLKHPAKENLFFSSGKFVRFVDEDSHFQLSVPLRVTPPNLVLDSFGFFQLFKEFVLEHQICHGRDSTSINGQFSEICDFNKHSPRELLSRIYLHAVTGEENSASNTSYSGFHVRDVTVLTGPTIALYAAVIVLAFLLCFFRELILFFAAGSNMHLAVMYQMNEYNQISKLLRRRMEREVDTPYSNTFADLGQIAWGDVPAAAELAEVDLESAW